MFNRSVLEAPAGSPGAPAGRVPTARSSNRARAGAPRARRGARVPYRRAERAASGRAALDEPDGGGQEEQREGEQPAALDPLERPEAAGGLVASPLRVAVLHEVPHGIDDVARGGGPPFE